MQYSLLSHLPPYIALSSRKISENSLTEIQKQSKQAFLTENGGKHDPFRAIGNFSQKLRQ